MTCGGREYSTSSASAGGQEEQPWLVKSSTTARGGSAKAGCRRAARPRAAKVSVKRDAMMAAMEHEFRLKGNSRYLERQRIVRKKWTRFFAQRCALQRVEHRIRPQKWSPLLRPM